MISNHDNTAEFLRKASELGLVDEINQRIEEKHNARRAELIAEMKNLPTAEQAGLPQLAKVAGLAATRLSKAKAELNAAQAAYDEASLGCYGAGLRFEGARNSLERGIKALAPDFIKEAHSDLDFLRQSVGHQVRVTVSNHWTVWGMKPTQESNIDEISALTADIRAAMNRLEAIVLEVTDLKKAQEEVSQLCQSLQARSFALGVDQHAFNARHAPRDHGAVAENSAAKKSAERRRHLATLAV